MRLLARSASCFRYVMAAGDDRTKNGRSPDSMVDFGPSKNRSKIELRYAQTMSHFFCGQPVLKREAPLNCRFEGSKTDTFHRGKGADFCSQKGDRSVDTFTTGQVIHTSSISQLRSFRLHFWCPGSSIAAMTYLKQEAFRAFLCCTSRTAHSIYIFNIALSQVG